MYEYGLVYIVVALCQRSPKLFSFSSRNVFDLDDVTTSNKKVAAATTKAHTHIRMAHSSGFGRAQLAAR